LKHKCQQALSKREPLPRYIAKLIHQAEQLLIAFAKIKSLLMAWQNSKTKERNLNSIFTQQIPSQEFYCVLLNCAILLVGWWPKRLIKRLAKPSGDGERALFKKKKKVVRNPTLRGEFCSGIGCLTERDNELRDPKKQVESIGTLRCHAQGLHGGFNKQNKIN